MHDPMHVAREVRRPWPNRPWRGRPDRARRPSGHRRLGPINIRARAAGRSRWRGRLYFSWAIWHIGGRSWYFPGWLTVWHVDPERDGTSSCRNAARAKRQTAIKRHAFFAAAWWDWWWRHYDKLHVHHWRIQLPGLQRLRRWLFTRCETCGERFPYGYSPVRIAVSGAHERKRRKTWRDRWLRGERDLHHGGPNRGKDCSALAHIRATKNSLPRWLEQWGRNEATMRMQRERAWYYGAYPWWREQILGETPEQAAVLAAAHIQRSCNGHHACDGRGCEGCDFTGHERVEYPIPAEAVG